MIRQNDQRDSYNQLKYGSVISYPSGKKHFYQDYLILGKTDSEITTVPLLLQNEHKMNHFDLPLSDSLNADLGDEYFTSTLNVNVIAQKQYERVNPIHILDLNPQEVKTHDQKTAVQIALVKKQYHSWLSIENSQASITRKHQALRRGLNKHRLLTKATLQKYLLGKAFAGNTENQEFNLASYVDQTYIGSIATNEPEANQSLCNKYADVDRLRKYDVIRYKAITGDRIKWRPFIVMGQNGESVDLVPVTHNRHTDKLDNKKGIYTIYHVNLSPAVSQAISIMNGDGRAKAANARSALSPCTQVTVSLKTFKRTQLPQYLGNLRDYTSMTEITQMENKKNEAINALMKSYENYLTEQKAFGHIRNYEVKLYRRQCVSTRDLQRIIDKYAFGQYSKCLNLSPAKDYYYLKQKAQNKLIYGVYQSSPSLMDTAPAKTAAPITNVKQEMTELEV